MKLYLEGPPSLSTLTHPDTRWMPIVDLRPYVGLTAGHFHNLAASHVAYWEQRSITPTEAIVRLDFGMTFGCPGHVENDKSGHPVLVGPSFEEALRGYSNGLLNYRKFTSLPTVGTDGWIGSEYTNLCAYVEGLGRYSTLTTYHDLLGEWMLTPEMRGANPTIDRLLDLLIFPRLNPTHTITNTITRAMTAAGASGRIIVPHLSRLSIPRNWLGGSEDATPLPRRFYSHHWWTAGEDEAYTYACGLHDGAGEPYFVHFSAAEQNHDSIRRRLKYQPRGGVIVFGTDLAQFTRLLEIPA